MLCHNNSNNILSWIIVSFTTCFAFLEQITSEYLKENCRMLPALALNCVNSHDIIIIEVSWKKKKHVQCLLWCRIYEKRHLPSEVKKNFPVCQKKCLCDYNQFYITLPSPYFQFFFVTHSYLVCKFVSMRIYFFLSISLVMLGINKNMLLSW